MALASLLVCVDYDNLEPAHIGAGPVNFSKAIAGLLPSETLIEYGEIKVRLYGGWRSGGVLTRAAQLMVPSIRLFNPGIHVCTHDGVQKNIRLIVELADKPIGAQAPLEEMLVQDRDLRKFRARHVPWANCGKPGSCGFGNYIGVDYQTECSSQGCSKRLSEVLVRDEQKMVDTLIIADLARQVFVDGAKDVVLVTSDSDMWPGILLVLGAGGKVIHVHAKSGRKTPRHLLNTIPSNLSKCYMQKSM